jgi:N-terminal domain of toast_rack, DUF2154
MLRTSAFAVPAFLLLLSSCGPEMHVQTGPLKTDRIHIDRGKAERANIELNIGAGELNVDPGSGSLMAGEFEYNVPEMEPVIHTSNNGLHAALTVRQPSHGGFNGGSVKNIWNVHLNPDVLWDIAVNCGAGKAELGLGSLTMRSLQVNIGVGQVDVDLEGTPKRDYDVTISGGIGQAIVHLPKEVGVRADVHGGIGSIDITGLDKQGDHYQNSLYDKSKVNLNLKVDGGIGQIRVIG